jgi:hypothetical protein
VGHFFAPFFLLLLRPIKRRAAALGGIALALLVLRWLDLYWLVAPSFHRAELGFDWMDCSALIGVGGVWCGVFLWNLRRCALAPLRDPRYSALLAGGGGDDHE